MDRAKRIALRPADALTPGVVGAHVAATGSSPRTTCVRAARSGRGPASRRTTSTPAGGIRHAAGSGRGPASRRAAARTLAASTCRPAALSCPSAAGRVGRLRVARCTRDQKHA